MPSAMNTNMPNGELKMCNTGHPRSSAVMLPPLPPLPPLACKLSLTSSAYDHRYCGCNGCDHEIGTGFHLLTA